MSKPHYLEIVSQNILSVERDKGADISFTHPIPTAHTAFAYVFAGEGVFGIGKDDDGKK